MTIAPDLGTQVLTLGSQGELVREVQLALASIGFKLKGTGYFGGATDTAVSAFQRAQGLTVDGDVGPKTAAALDAATAHAGKIVVPPEVTDRPLWLIEALKWINLKEGAGAKDNRVHSGRRGILRPWKGRADKPEECFWTLTERHPSLSRRETRCDIGCR